MRFRSSAFVLMMFFFCSSAIGQKSVIDATLKSKDHSELLKFIKAAGIYEMLLGAGPFTIFAPTNAAFNKLSSAKKDYLLNPENKKVLTPIILTHIIAGNIEFSSIVKAIKDGNGKTVFKNMNGTFLTATLKGDQVLISDGSALVASVSITDLKAGNGILHPIDTFLSSY